jgi:P4 family phage/plasmid primase-like protien
MQSSIDKLLIANRTDGAIKTHVSMGKYSGSYMFDARGIEGLFDTYCESISEGVNVCLAEMLHNTKCLPILVDIDIKVKEEGDDDFGDKVYTDDHIEKVVQIYQSVIRYIVESCTDDLLLCAVLEKPSYRDTVNGVTYLKNGFHLHFPNIFMLADDQKAHLIPRVNDGLQKNKVFDDLSMFNCNVKVDEGYCNAPWLMYGSKKDINKQPYKVTKVINSDGDILTVEQAFKNYKVYDNVGHLIKYSRPIEYYLPRILSILPFPVHLRRQTFIKQGLLSPIKEKIKNNPERQKQQYKKSVEDDMKVVSDILPMLSDYRAEDRNEWMTVGWVLYTISHGSQDGLDLWCEFSSRCEDSYDESKCIYEWDRMVAKNFSLGTLRYFAMQDSPEEYDAYKKACAKRYMEDSINLSGTHYDIAKILYEEYKDEYVCYSLRDRLGEWYRFNGLRWEYEEQGISLLIKLSTEVHDSFKAILDKEKHEQDDENPTNQAKIKQIRKIMADLKKSGFKESVLKECKALFYNKHFIDRLNTNKYLIGFRNGVYDLKTHKLRAGMPEDYISKSLGINYVEYDLDCDEVHEVYNYLEKVFPNKNIRKYFLDIYSDLFVGGNQRKHIHFWTGSGHNAKSVTQAIFEKIMAEYGTKLETPNVTGKKPGAGSANADIARLSGGIRWVAIEEPDQKEEFNVGILKHLSGNDTCYARDLYEKGKQTKEFLPLFKLAVICNDLPTISYSDEAIWNRIRVIKYESKFCDPDDPDEIVPESYEEQLQQKRFPMDKTFMDEKLPKILEPFAWVLLNHRKNGSCMIEPLEVKAATALFRKNNDIYRQFVEEALVQVPSDNTVVLTITDLYNRFKSWFRESFPGTSLPNKEEVKRHFHNIWRKNETSHSSWTGYRVRNESDTYSNSIQQTGTYVMPSM